MAAVPRVLSRLIGGWLALCVLLTLIAGGLKLFGDLPWSTLGVWLLVDLGLLALRSVLLLVARRLDARAQPRLP
jgi:hypothetical protein